MGTLMLGNMGMWIVTMGGVAVMFCAVMDMVVNHPQTRNMQDARRSVKVRGSRSHWIPQPDVSCMDPSCDCWEPMPYDWQYDIDLTTHNNNN